MTDNRSESYKSGISPNKQKDSNSYSTDLYRHYELLCAGKGVPLSRGMFKNEGLSFLPGEPRSVKEMNDYPWQFGPGSPYDYVSQYFAVEQMPISEYGKSAEIELEWQYVLRQQQAPKCEQPPYSKSRESYEGVLNDNFDKEAKDCTSRVETESSTISSFLAGSTTENSFDTGTSKSSRISGSLSAELDSVKSYPKEGTQWRTADSKELAALVSQKSHGFLENCDLPPSQSSFSWRGHIICSDSNPSKNVKTGNLLYGDQKQQQYSLHSKLDKSQPEDLKPGMQDTTTFAEHLPNVSEPMAIPSNSIPTSNDGTRKHRSPKQGYETLGEALCHSQTRARQGEKLAAKAIEERDKVAQLLFREACAARTYKQWVETLELENRLLRMRYECPSEGCFKKQSCSQCHSGTCHNNVVDKKVDSPWKNGRKRKKGNHRQWQGKGSRGWASDNNALVRCTIGLAFALGLSFAGAGLVIGWSMGWILLAN